VPRYDGCSSRANQQHGYGGSSIVEQFLHGTIFFKQFACAQFLNGSIIVI
jgi:hypothetical protein